MVTTVHTHDRVMLGVAVARDLIDLLRGFWAWLQDVAVAAVFAAAVIGAAKAIVDRL